MPVTRYLYKCVDTRWAAGEVNEKVGFLFKATVHPEITFMHVSEMQFPHLNIFGKEKKNNFSKEQRKYESVTCDIWGTGIGLKKGEKHSVVKEDWTRHFSLDWPSPVIPHEVVNENFGGFYNELRSGLNNCRLTCVTIARQLKHNQQ